MPLRPTQPPCNSLNPCAVGTIHCCGTCFPYAASSPESRSPSASTPPRPRRISSTLRWMGLPCWMSSTAAAVVRPRGLPPPVSPAPRFPIPAQHEPAPRRSHRRPRGTRLPRQRERPSSSARERRLREERGRSSGDAAVGNLYLGLLLLRPRRRLLLRLLVRRPRSFVVLPSCRHSCCWYQPQDPREKRLSRKASPTSRPHREHVTAGPDQMPLCP